MRYLNVVAAVLRVCVVARAQEGPKIREGIRYTRASAEMNEKAKELLRKNFGKDAKEEEAVGLFEKLLFCGPGLWWDLKEDEGLAKLQKGKMIIQVPRREQGKVVRMEKLEGKMFQTSDEMRMFWRAFVARTELGEFKIRKVTEAELDVFWATISFDIDEPLLVMESESGKHKVLVNFAPPRKEGEELKIVWMDDFRHYRIEEKKKGPR